MTALERLEWQRPRALAGAELLFVDNSIRAWHVFHERYTICACRRAAAAWRYRGQSLFYGDRSLGLMEPGETHCNTFVYEPMDFRVLFVSPEAFLRAAEERGHAGVVHFRLAQVGDPRLYSAILRLAASVEAGESPLEQQSWLSICLHRMLDHAERAPASSPGTGMRPVVTRAMEYLRERFREPVDLDDLAALTGGGRYQLIHAFSRSMGIPPHAYQIHVRIERARAMLERGVPPITVAAEVGFADQSHFTRHFKRIMQVTPGQYARSKRGRWHDPAGGRDEAW